jgi:transitional endoplasmic reticulum ATPase
LSDARPERLPAWTEELKQRYLRGEAIQFVLHGNVNDLLLHKGAFVRIPEFLCENLLRGAKDMVIQYDLATGVRFVKKSAAVPDLDVLLTENEPGKVLPVLEKILLANDRVGIVIDYAEMIAPAGDLSFSSVSDRQNVVTLHRWSYSPIVERADSVVLLVTENLLELSEKLVSNPTTAILRVPMPDLDDRRAAIAALAPALSADAMDRLAEITAGLKIVQLKAILTPDAGPGPLAKAATVDERVLDLIRKRKREILERDCFGMVEFVEPEHDFSAVGGMDEVKRELTVLAQHMRDGNHTRCPMGMLLTGPMGTGKTFVAEAFVKETGLTGIKLKNFRSKWVGSTEGNLDKILSVVTAIGQVVVIVDEGDRALGGQEGEDDGGTSSRIVARLKEFMSDTTHRGHVLFLLLTNRPDKLDVDIKRAGRLDRKIPFFYPQEPEEVEAILLAQLKRHKVAHPLEFPRDREEISAKLVGYSSADIEALGLLANDYAGDGPAALAHFRDAVRDYLPARDVEMLEYMELLAVFEASNRRMLPKKYRDLGMAELQERVTNLRLTIGRRR